MSERPLANTARDARAEWYFVTEPRVGLHERECRAWIEALRSSRRTAGRVADEIERAVDAALAADLVIPGQPFVVRPRDSDAVCPSALTQVVTRVGGGK